MTSTYKEKVLNAISLAQNINELDYIDEKIKTTLQINRRTVAGRELERELLNLTNQKARQLIENGEPPF